MMDSKFAEHVNAPPCPPPPLPAFTPSSCLPSSLHLSCLSSLFLFPSPVFHPEYSQKRYIPKEEKKNQRKRDARVRKKKNEITDLNSNVKPRLQELASACKTLMEEPRGAAQASNAWRLSIIRIKKYFRRVCLALAAEWRARALAACDHQFCRERENACEWMAGPSMSATPVSHLAWFCSGRKQTWGARFCYEVLSFCRANYQTWIMFISLSVHESAVADFQT